MYNYYVFEIFTNPLKYNILIINKMDQTRIQDLFGKIWQILPLSPHKLSETILVFCVIMSVKKMD